MSIKEETMQYAKLLKCKRTEYSDLLERVEIKTPWHVVEEICENNDSNVTPAIEISLMMDVLRITKAGLITLGGNR